MRPRDRFIQAIELKEPDRVPCYDFLFQKPMFTEIIGRTPDAYNARDAMDLTKALELDAVWIPFGCFAGWTPEKLSDNVYKDEWGTTFEHNDTSWPIDAPIDYPLKDRSKLAGYTPPDPNAEGRLADIEEAVNINKELGDECVAIAGGVVGPLTLAWMLVGYEDIAYALHDDPGFLKEIASIAVDFAKVGVTRMAQAGVDCMFVSEDLGSSTEALISPRHFDDIYKPALDEIVRHTKDCGLYALLHTCGHVYEFLDDFVEIGFDAVHPLQRTAGMDLAWVKKNYGDKFCIIGNIDSSATLPYGTPQQVAEEVKQAIRDAAPGGGYVLASDHSLHDGISVENIKTLFETGREFGAYPLKI